MKHSHRHNYAVRMTTNSVSMYVMTTLGCVAISCAAVYFILLNIRYSLIARSGLGIYYMRVVSGIDVLLSDDVHDDDGVLIFRVDSSFRDHTSSPVSTIMRNVYMPVN